MGLYSLIWLYISFPPSYLIIFVTFMMSFILQCAAPIMREVFGIKYSSKRIKIVEFLIGGLLTFYGIIWVLLSISFLSAIFLNGSIIIVILSSYIILFCLGKLIQSKLNEDYSTIYRVWIRVESVTSIILASVILTITFFYSVDVLLLLILSIILAASSNMVFAVKGRKPIVDGTSQ